MAELKTTKFKIKMLKETSKPETKSELSSNYTGHVITDKEYKYVTVDAPTACEAYVMAKKLAGESCAWTPVGFEIIGPDNQMRS